MPNNFVSYANAISLMTGINNKKVGKSDLTDIFATGTTNNTGSEISSGTYFYLNNELVKAIDDIAIDAQFVEDTNYEITNGVLNEETSTGGGHVIQDASGNELPQESDLQFAGYLKTTDNQSDGKTIVSDAPTEISYDDYMAMSTSEKQGTKWLITDAPGHLDTNQAIFTLNNQDLTFTGTTATISDQRINTSTYPLIYWADSSIEAAAEAHITSTISNGQITFTAENTPSSTLTCDIVFISNAYSGGGSGSGHEIENSAGTKLTQRDVMQVTDGLEAVDDSTNQKTKIKMNLPTISLADWNAMTEQERTAYKASHYRFGVELPDTSGVINAEYMKLLWENTNPTTPMSVENITLNSADYDLLLVLSNYSISSGASVASAIAPKGKDIWLTHTVNKYNNNGRSRLLTYNSATSYTTDHAYNGNAEVNDNLVIPIAIYGIKASFQFKVNAIATELSTSASHCFLSDNETTVEDKFDELTNNNAGTSISLSSYTQANPYICPSDGYMLIVAGNTSGNVIFGRVWGVNGEQLATMSARGASQGDQQSVFVRKGCKIAPIINTGTGNNIYFMPLQ